MNELPCGRCRNYDVIIRGTKPTSRAWCAKLSIYPHKDKPGRMIPKGAQRAAAGEPPKPYIVRKDQVYTACTHAKEADYDPAKYKAEKLYPPDDKDRVITP